MRTVALIPARQGSKGLPGKNWRTYQGETLVSRALRLGNETCNAAYVTTDCEAESGPSVIRRPPALAQDDTPMIRVVHHALEVIGPCDVVVLLQPTQPLRTRLHVIRALRLLEESGADSVVSVVEVPQHFSPDYVGMIQDGRIWFPKTTRRQDCAPVYSRDGTVYVTRRATIEAGSLYGDDCRALIVPAAESINVDTVEDWDQLERLAHA